MNDAGIPGARRLVRDRRALRVLWPGLLGTAVLIGGCGHETETRDTASPELARLDAQGRGLPEYPGDTGHFCVFDSRTGLTWEVKRADSGLHDPSHTYSWFSAEPQVHMSDPGVPDGGHCGLGRCDTDGFVEAVNSAGLCGHADWRVPTREELMSLGVPAPDGRGHVVDRRFFPHGVEGEFWTASTFGMYPSSAWAVDTKNGLDRVDAKAAAKRVRLVRRDDPARGIAP